jgi:hypothetical protein
MGSGRRQFCFLAPQEHVLDVRTETDQRRQPDGSRSNRLSVGASGGLARYDAADKGRRLPVFRCRAIASKESWGEAAWVSSTRRSRRRRIGRSRSTLSTPRPSTADQILKDRAEIACLYRNLINLFNRKYLFEGKHDEAASFLGCRSLCVVVGR